MPSFASSLPLWLLTVLIVTGTVLLAIAGLFVARRSVLPRLRISPRDSEFAGAMLQAILVFYALAITLVAVSTWEQHSAISDQTSLEAATLGTLYRQAELLPGEAGDELRLRILDYARYVVEDAWPAQERGETGVEGGRLVSQIQQTLGAYEPTSAGMQAVHAEALDTFRDMVELRRLRIDAVSGHTSGAVWVFVALGGVISLASSYLFSVADAKLHAALVALLAAMIGLVVTLIAGYDRPFSGDLAVGPQPFEVLLDTASAEQADP